MLFQSIVELWKCVKMIGFHCQKMVVICSSMLRTIMILFEPFIHFWAHIWLSKLYLAGIITLNDWDMALHWVCKCKMKLEAIVICWVIIQNILNWYFICFHFQFICLIVTNIRPPDIFIGRSIFTVETRCAAITIHKNIIRNYSELSKNGVAYFGSLFILLNASTNLENSSRTLLL